MSVFSLSQRDRQYANHVRFYTWKIFSFSHIFHCVWTQVFWGVVEQQKKNNGRFQSTPIFFGKIRQISPSVEAQNTVTRDCPSKEHLTNVLERDRDSFGGKKGVTPELLKLYLWIFFSVFFFLKQRTIESKSWLKFNFQKDHQRVYSNPPSRSVD